MLPARSGLLSALVFLGAAGALAEPARHVKASLLAEVDAVVPGQPLAVGIRLEMEDGWHTYWQNPGDSGLPTRVRWELPEGFAAGEIGWPYPMRFRTGPLVSYGYERDVLLPVQIRVPASLGSREVRLAARVDWLECQEACLPGRADLSLTLPVRATQAAGSHAALFAEARRRLPAKDPGWRITGQSRPPSLRLMARAPRGTTLRDAWFYPAAPRVLDHAKAQPLLHEGTTHRLDLPLDPNGAAPERLAGVLVARTASGTLALEVDAPVTPGPAPKPRTQETKP